MRWLSLIGLIGTVLVAVCSIWLLLLAYRIVGRPAGQDPRYDASIEYWSGTFKVAGVLGILAVVLQVIGAVAERLWASTKRCSGHGPAPTSLLECRLGACTVCRHCLCALGGFPARRPSNVWTEGRGDGAGRFPHLGVCLCLCRSCTFGATVGSHGPRYGPQLAVRTHRRCGPVGLAVLALRGSLRHGLTFQKRPPAAGHPTQNASRP